MKKTLGLTGLTMNAMALIAPGAFLWLTTAEQCGYGAPMAGASIWIGIVFALVLCLATAVSYAELSKLYPGAGSSYFYAEQAFLSKTNAYKFARLAKFITGWASHLYYWVYPGLMVGVTAILVGYMAGNFWPDTFNSSVASPTLMIAFCVIFSFAVAYIAYIGVTSATTVNIAMNVIQISALVVFSVIAIGYRTSHNKDGDDGLYMASSGKPVPYQVFQENVPDNDESGKQKVGKDGKPQFVQDQWSDDAKTAKVDDKGQPQWKQQDKIITEDDLKSKELPLPKTYDSSFGQFTFEAGDPFPDYEKDKDGKPVLKDGVIQPLKYTLSWSGTDAISPGGTKFKDGKPAPSDMSDEAQDKAGFKADFDKDPQTFNFHASAASVVAPHNFSWIIIQACVAILILVGFESCTAMGEEARNAKKDIPRAVILSLVIQGAICYLFEYFAFCYLLNNGYKMPQAAGSSAPLGDLMVLSGTWLFHSYSAGVLFMRIQALTVFLALIGTTLSCLSTGVRVTYAMGRDDEVPSHFGLLHGKTLTPHRAIWTLATISAVLGIVTVMWYLCGKYAPDALNTALTDAQKNSIWYPKFLTVSKEFAVKVPNSLITVGLLSNFGTFMLYMLTCVTAIVAFRQHHMFNGIKHMVIPVFGMIANLLCMLFYLIGPFTVAGMSLMEPYVALGIAAAWGLYGAIYFSMASKKKGKTVFVAKPAEATPVSV
jgi:amino acid transporter